MRQRRPLQELLLLSLSQRQVVRWVLSKAMAGTWPEVFLTPACCHLFAVLSFQNTWPRNYKDIRPEAEWERPVQRSAGGRGRVTTMTLREAAGARKILSMRPRDTRRVLAVKPRKANWGSVPLSNHLLLFGKRITLPFFHAPIWLQPSNWDLAGVRLCVLAS